MKKFIIILFFVIFSGFPLSIPAQESVREYEKRGEYKIRPYKGFPDECRGEPCVHPAFLDRLPGPPRTRYPGLSNQYLL